jgi:DNA-binding protein H-NS
MVCREDAEFRLWESILESEGLGEHTRGRELLFADPRTLERTLTPEQARGTWSGAVDLGEQQAASALMAWLPEEDRKVIRWGLDGVPQSLQGERLGITQSSVSDRHKAALERLLALAEVRESLPVDRVELYDLVRNHWPWRGAAARPAEDAAQWVVAVTQTWTGRGAADRVGIPEGTTIAWMHRILDDSTPELEPVRVVLSVIREHRTLKVSR